MKKLLAVIIALALFCAALTALTESDESVAGQINFYYQLDGGETDKAGTWDNLLRERLKALCGHSVIYNDKTTSKYLTGRGCRLFAFAHAYQYLLGYAETESDKADILYNFLSIKPKWSDLNSSLSPPNAQSIYAAYLAEQDGVTAVSAKLNSYSALVNFFAAGRGVIIVNAPGHIILAVGCVKHDGTAYVHIVDSILYGTIRTGRCLKAKSMDFSQTYTPKNSRSLSPFVHEYWLPYSEFSSKCKILKAFRSTASVTDMALVPTKDTILLSVNESRKIEFSQGVESVVYLSSDSAVCSVSEDGVITANDFGRAVVTCSGEYDSFNTAEIEVCVADFPQPQNVVFISERDDNLPEYDGTLPDGAYVVYDSIENDGVFESVAHIFASDGDALIDVPVTLVYPNADTTLALPGSLVNISSEAFANIGAEYLVISSDIQSIASDAFANCDLKAIICAESNAAIEAFANEIGCVLAVDSDAAAYQFLRN